jgi:phosphotriesterase-related protein
MTGPLIRTVTGDIQAQDAGTILMHEHLCGDWTPLAGDPDVLVTDPRIVLQELRAASQSGLQTIVDATPNDIGGRHLESIRKLASSSGVQVVAGCGFYRDVTYPEWVKTATEDDLVEFLVRQVQYGIDDSGVPAGVFGEIGTGPDGISPVEGRVLRAVGAASAATGVAVVTHTMEGKDAVAQLQLLLDAGADPAGIAIGHLDCSTDTAMHVDIAQAGAFLGFDRVGLAHWQADEVRADLIVSLVERDFAGQIVLAGDLSRQSRLQANGGTGYAGPLENFLPLLMQRGLPAEVVHTFVVDNPQRLLSFVPVSDERG